MGKFSISFFSISEKIRYISMVDVEFDVDAEVDAVVKVNSEVEINAQDGFGANEDVEVELTMEVDPPVEVEAGISGDFEIDIDDESECNAEANMIFESDIEAPMVEIEVAGDSKPDFKVACVIYWIFCALSIICFIGFVC